MRRVRPLLWLRLRMAGRGPFVVAAVMVLLGIVAVSFVPVWGRMSTPPFRAPVDRVQERSMVEPFEVGAVYPRRTEYLVQEPGFEFRYEKPAGGRGYSTDTKPVRRLQVVRPEDEFDSPLGRCRIRAFAVATNPRVGYPVSESQQGVLYGPDLLPMSEGAVAALEREVGGDRVFAELGRVYFEPYDSGGIAVIVEKGPDDNSIATRLGFCDARTGRGKSAVKAGFEQCVETDRGPRIFHAYPFSIQDWHCGASNLWFEWDGDVSSTRLGMKPGWKGMCGEYPITLVSISGSDKGQRWTEREGGVVEQGKSLIRLAKSIDHTTFEIAGLPHGEEIELHKFGGDPIRWLPAKVSKSYRNNGSIAFTVMLPRADLKVVSLIHRKNRDRVFIDLPFLPRFPDQNHEVRDFQEMRVPPSTFSDRTQLAGFLSNCLQANLNVYDLPLRPGVRFPMSFASTTVGELLQTLRDIHPSHGILQELTLPDDWLDITLQRPGETLAERYPRLGWLIANLQLIGLIAFGLAAALLLVKGLTFAIGARLRRTLRARGFAEMTVFDAEELCLRLLGLTRRIPSHDEVASVPGVDPADMRSIANFMESQRKDRLS